MARIDYRIARKYFSNLSTWAWTLAVFTVLCFFGVFSGDSELIGPSIVLAILLGIPAFFCFKNIKKLSDVLEEINTKIKSEILDKATNALGIDIEQCNVIDPVIMSGDAYSNNFTQFRYHAGDDFTSNHRFLVLLFSENQVFYYDYTFSLISDEENVTSGEFFYRDVVAFKTESKTMELAIGGNNRHNLRKASKLTFSLMTTGGNAFETPINKSDEEKIQGMRQLLREKKNAMN